MKYLVAIGLCWLSIHVIAQESKNIKLASAYFKEVKHAAKNQRLWKQEIYGPTLFVEPNSRVAFSNVQDKAGILSPRAGIFTGILPRDVMIANTSITWQEQQWSVILWPLPVDHDERISLMIHESYHRIQRKMGFSDSSPTADHLSIMQGRIYFLLELMALKAAIGKPVNKRNEDLKNALVFRNKRQELFPTTFENERILEMNEGLAEFTGLILGRKKSSIVPHLFSQVDTAGNRKSLIRSSPYLTGPIYGYILYEKDKKWTANIDSTTSFPLLISKTYAFALPERVTDKELADLQKKYNGEDIVQAEEQKEKVRLKTVANYKAIYTSRPILHIRLIKMNIQFNPNNLFDLDDLGTIYPTAEIKDNWGTLTVFKNGMLMKDWSTISLPMEGFTENQRSINGNGWQLILKEGWSLKKMDELNYRIIEK
jgi:hypothetical protein